MKLVAINKISNDIESVVFQNPALRIAKPLPARLKKETVEHKLKILKREIEHIIKKLTDWKNFVFADPLLPFGTIREANVQCTHLQIAPTDPLTEICKRVQFPPISKLKFLQ